MARDSRAEARKVRRALFRLLEPSQNQRKKSKWVDEILLGLARREYEAGYAAGSVKTHCCYAGSVQPCPHHEARRRG